jgi:hypothetical protein
MDIGRVGALQRAWLDAEPAARVFPEPPWHHWTNLLPYGVTGVTVSTLGFVTYKAFRRCDCASLPFLALSGSVMQLLRRWCFAGTPRSPL